MKRYPNRARRARNHADVPYELDRDCQRFIAEHQGGATLDEVGQFFGVSRERVRQIEAQALAKLAEIRGELAAFRLPDRPSWVDRISETGP